MKIKTKKALARLPELKQTQATIDEMFREIEVHGLTQERQQRLLRAVRAHKRLAKELRR